MKRQIEIEQEELLRDLIKETIILEKMAYDREHFIDKMDEYLTGAIREFYKARLAEKYFSCRNQDVNHYNSKMQTSLEKYVEIINFWKENIPTFDGKFHIKRIIHVLKHLKNLKMNINMK
jgi:hypothetical protein